MKKILTNCFSCNKEFFIVPSKLKYGRGKFCSVDCKIKFIKKNRTKTILKKCLNCEEEFMTFLSNDKKFCSLKCKAEGQSKGLTKPMRKGTGYSLALKKLSTKFFKYKSQANKVGIKLDYSFEQLVKRIKESKCEYCGNNNNEVLGLDRIDNTLQHTNGNTVVCCELCNMTRGNRFTVEEMKKIGKIIKTFNKNNWKLSDNMKSAVNNKIKPIISYTQRIGNENYRLRNILNKNNIEY